MSENPILDEIHQIRAELSDRFAGDIQAIGRHLLDLQSLRGGPTISRPPKPPLTLILGNKRPATEPPSESSTTAVNHSAAQ